MKFSQLPYIGNQNVMELADTERKPQTIYRWIGLSQYMYIIVEIDENQHCAYEDENRRVQDLIQDLKDKPLVIIRFNPDGYITPTKKKNQTKLTYFYTF